MSVLDWFRRSRGGPSPELAEMKTRADGILTDAVNARQASAAVSSSLRESRAVNHYAESFWQAMGGSPA